jgi:hypothetical protein
LLLKVKITEPRTQNTNTKTIIMKNIIVLCNSTIPSCVGVDPSWNPTIHGYAVSALITAKNVLFKTVNQQLIQ